MADPWEAFEVAVDPEGLSWFELGRYDLAELSRGTYGAVSQFVTARNVVNARDCLLYTSPSPRDKRQSRMPSSA